MPTYEILEASVDVAKRSGSKEYGKEKFFILVDGEDGKKYQVKLNEPKQRHNINEFIAHYVGTCSGMPLLGGAFMHLDDYELDRLRTGLAQEENRSLKSVDLEMMKKGYFFGVEWKQNLTRIANQDELMPRVNETSNRRDFYALFSFDQYLKNHDRHHGNHLVVQERNVKRYHMVDFDRIFKATHWRNVPLLINDFTPVCSHPYHAFLMHQVDSVSIRDVHAYAGAIAAINDADVQSMCDIITGVYDVPEHEVRNIYRWMTTRKSQIVMKCFENERHFPNVAQKGLYSVDRQAQ